MRREDGRNVWLSEPCQQVIRARLSTGLTYMVRKGEDVQAAGVGDHDLPRVSARLRLGTNVDMLTVFGQEAATVSTTAVPFQSTNKLGRS